MFQITHSVINTFDINDSSDSYDKFKQLISK